MRRRIRKKQIHKRLAISITQTTVDCDTYYWFFYFSHFLLSRHHTYSSITHWTCYFIFHLSILFFLFTFYRQTKLLKKTTNITKVGIQKTKKSFLKQKKWQIKIWIAVFELPSGKRKNLTMIFFSFTVLRYLLVLVLVMFAMKHHWVNSFIHSFVFI